MAGAVLSDAHCPPILAPTLSNTELQSSIDRNLPLASFPIFHGLKRESVRQAQRIAKEQKLVCAVNMSVTSQSPACTCHSPAVTPTPKLHVHSLGIEEWYSTPLCSMVRKSSFQFLQTTQKFSIRLSYLIDVIES